MKDTLTYLCALSEFTRTGPKRPPQRLVNWIRAMGGLRDDHGEVSNITGGRHMRLYGLIDNKRGVHLDDATQAAWDAGYIPSQDRPHIDELLELLERDLSGDHVYSCDDSQQVYEFEQCELARNTLDELGILADTPKKQIRAERALMQFSEQMQ